MDVMNAVNEHGPCIGMGTLISEIQNTFPKLKYGYFNPPKEKF